jgi:hypothetical protein
MAVPMTTLTRRLKGTGTMNTTLDALPQGVLLAALFGSPMISRHSREDLLYGACVIGPPKTPSVFILFLNWKLNQQISSTFLVFDLVGRDVGFKRERNAGRFVHPKLDDAHKALRFRPRPRIGVMEYWSTVPSRNCAPHPRG